MRPQNPPPGMFTPAKQHRERWIAEAAYYRAEKRGFTPGYALEDWLAAEALVNFELARFGNP